MSEEDLAGVLGALRLDAEKVRAAEWIDNGPGWLGLVLDSAETVLSLRPDFGLLGIDTGVLGAHDPTEVDRLGVAVEVRAFCPGHTIPEDPVTGSLNAGFGVWLTRTGVLPPSYVARQGTALGRDGRVAVSTDEAGDVWVGGDASPWCGGPWRSEPVTGLAPVRERVCSWPHPRRRTSWGGSPW